MTYESEKLRAFLEREKLRVWDHAERTLAERLNPADTLTVREAIAGHEQELGALYQEMLLEDVTIRRLEVACENQPR